MDEAIDIQNINKIYRHIINTDARIVICYGGRDSGKSYFVGGQYVPSLLCSDAYFRGVAVRKVFATHRDSCFTEVADGLDVLADMEYDRQAKEAEDRAERRAEKVCREMNTAIEAATAEEINKADALAEQAEAKERKRLVKNAKERANYRIKKLGEVDEAERAEILAKEMAQAKDELKVISIKEHARLIHEAEAAAEQRVKELKKQVEDVHGGSILQEELDAVDVWADGVKYKQSPLEISHENGNKLLFRGLDRPKKLKSLKGLNFVWVEEAEDLSREEFYELLLLLRGGNSQRIVLTFNPVDEGHFSNGMFVECPADEVIETFTNGDKKVWIKYLDVTVEGSVHRIKALCLRTTYEDNAYISIERKAAIEQLANTDPYLYDVYRLGKFGTRGGRILINIEEVDFKQRELKFINFDNRGYAQDFGFNHANCILALAERDNNLYVFDELYGHKKDTDEWIEAANGRGLDRRLKMVCDSAEPDRIKTWCRNGYRAVGVKKYPGSVNGQIDRLKRYDKIYIDSKCKNTLREVREWKWQQNKDGRFIDVPQNYNDDAMAALRYGCDLFGESKAEMRTVGVKR